MKKYTALYLRVSTDDQSINSQYNEIVNYLKIHSKEQFFSVYNDEGFSGTNGNRKELQRLLKDIQAGHIQEVIVYKLDRLFRSLKDLISTLTEWERLGVRFVFVKEGIDLSTPAGRLMMHLIGAFAEFEAALIRERVRAGMKNAREKGTKSGKPIGRPKVILPFIEKTKSYGALAKELNVSKTTLFRKMNKQ